MSAISKPESPNNPDRPLLVDIKVVAKLLGRSQQSIARDDKQGKLPRALRLGSSKRWDLGEIQQWVAAKCPPRDVWQTRSDKSEALSDQPSTRTVDRRETTDDSDGGA